MAIPFSNKKSTSKKGIWIGIAVLIVLWILGKSITVLKPVFRVLTKPFVSTGKFVGDHLVPSDGLLRSKQELLAEIDSLKKENETLVLQNGDLSAKLGYTNEFKDLFGTVPAESAEIFAPVVSKPNQSLYDTLILGVGHKDGVTAGKGIFVNRFALLGVIENASDHTSQARLFSSPSEKTVGRLERTGYDVTLVGRGGGNMIVEIPKEIETALGDRIVYPMNHNAVIGIIRDITLDDRDANKKLYITLPANILSLDHVYIEK